MRHLSLILAASLLAFAPAATAAPTKAKRPAVTRAKAPAKPVAKPAPAAIAPLPETAEIAELRRAYRFAVPIHEILRTRAAQLARAKAAGLDNAVNFILPKRDLADASSRDVTTPNNDTLYGSAWLDVAAGPVILTVPPLAGRYNSAAIMGLNSDNIAILGTRTGGSGGRYALVGPQFSGAAPAGTELVRLPTNDAWLLVRVLVNGKDDLDAANTALSGFTLEATAADAPLALSAPGSDAQGFVTAVTDALARSPGSMLAEKARTYPALAAWDSLSPETRALWTKSLPALRAELKTGLADAGDVVAGWSYPKFGIGDSGADDDLRALIAIGGLAALPRIEAMYLSARTDKDGAALTGSNAYRVRIPARMPLGGFWSLTLYQQEANGNLFFVANDLDRFAVGDRSKHLRSDRDGSYEIFVQAARPSGERVVNWLPAPSGKFVLIFRAYLPRAEFLDGSFRLPPVEIGEVIP